MRVLRGFGPVALAASLLLSCGGALAASAEKGKGAYIQHGCWQCHGLQAQGGIAGPKLAPDPMPLETFTAYVRTTNRAMPPYSEAILPNEDLADMHAYLETIPKPADYKDIPLLNQ
jgi:mono/diheme cytochrome c family protein